MREAASASLGRIRAAVCESARAALARVHPPTLDARLARIEAAAGGRLHVAAADVATGRIVTHRAHDAAPLASTVKLALAVEALARVDAGTLTLETAVTVRVADGVIGDGALDVLFRDAAAAPVTRTVADLLRLSLVESDNTATDRLFALVGGPPAVQHAVSRLGMAGMCVDRTIGEVLAERRKLRDAARGDLATGSRAFLADGRDTTTAAAMAALLSAIHRGAGLSASSGAHLTSLMRSCGTGARRIRAGVPAGAIVAHKTGNLPREVTADVGLVTLADGRTIAVAVYVVGSVAPIAVRDAAIASAARVAVTALA